MTKILAVTTHGTDDQTKSSLAFITAAGALEAGKEVAIALLGEGVYLAKEEIAKSVHARSGAALPAMREHRPAHRRGSGCVLCGCARGGIPGAVAPVAGAALARRQAKDPDTTPLGTLANAGWIGTPGSILARR